MNPNQAPELTEVPKVKPAETSEKKDNSPVSKFENVRLKFGFLASGIKDAFRGLKEKSPQITLDSEEEDMNIHLEQLSNLGKNTKSALENPGMIQIAGELQSDSLKKDLNTHHSDTPRVIEGMIGRGEKWNKSLAQAVMNLHDGIERKNENKEPIPDTKKPPKVILVTATSAIPYAVAIKECWKTAYPSESSPKFFFVDVSKRRFGLNTGSQRILRDENIEQVDLLQLEKLRGIGEKYDAFGNTAVFDEYKHSGQTLKEVQKQLQQAGFTNANFMHGNWGYQHPEKVITPQIRPVIRKGDKDSPYRPLTVHVNEDSKKLVTDMRMVGRQMGNEILQHI